MQSISLTSNAKVNIGLHITGKRNDGYHLMETVYYPVPELFDSIVITLTAGQDCEIRMVGIEEEVPLENNLCYKAWKLLLPLRGAKPGGVRMVVEKRIPAGAGLGGGSSNAATVLRGLNEVWELGLGKSELAAMGETLGADVPFFIYNVPLYATGIGTVFEPCNLDLGNAGYEIRVRVLPLHSSTPLAFKTLDWTKIEQGQPLKELLNLPVEAWRGNVRNDLEQSVFPRLPEVEAAKDALYAEGAVYAAMSGSGSACFGIFRK